MGELIEKLLGEKITEIYKKYNLTEEEKGLVENTLKLPPSYKRAYLANWMKEYPNAVKAYTEINLKFAAKAFSKTLKTKKK